jgi:hypothetical protein
MFRQLLRSTTRITNNAGSRAATSIRKMHTPSALAQSYIDAEEKFGAHNYHPLPVVLKRFLY